MIKVGDIVEFSFSPSFVSFPLYGIVIEQTQTHPTRYTVNPFNGNKGRGLLGYSASHPIKISDG